MGWLAGNLLKRSLRTLLGAALCLLAGLPAVAQQRFTTPVRQYGGGALLSAAISPNASLIASGSGRGGYLWDAATGAILGPLEYAKALESLCFSPDNRLLAAGTADGKVLLWEAATRRTVMTLTGFPGAVTDVKFSPDGALLLSGCLKEAALWNVQTGARIRTIRHPSATITDIDFSRDGTWILTAHTDGAAVLWDAQTGNQIRKLDGHSEAAHAAKISPDKSKALTVSSDNTAIVWDLRSGAKLKTLQHDSNLYDAAFSPDGALMLTASSGGVFTFYNAATYSVQNVIYSSSGGWHSGNAEFLGDGQRLFSGATSGDLILWDRGLGKPAVTYRKHTAFIRDGLFSPNGAQVLLGMDAFCAQLYDVNTAELLRTFDRPLHQIGSINAVAYSRDGSKILAGTADQAVIWKTATAEVIRSIPVEAEFVMAVAYAPDEKKVLTGDDQGWINLWDAATGAKLSTFIGHQGEITSLAFSPDGARILSGSVDKTAILWDAATCEPLATIPDHKGTVTAVAFSPDGSTMATVGADALVRLWNSRTLGLIRTLAGHKQTVAAVKFSPDGKTLLTGSRDTTAILWDVASGAAQRIYDRHTDTVNAVAFSPDGAAIMTASTDGTALLWLAREPNAVRAWAPYR